MEWREFKGWLAVKQAQMQGPEVSPESWAGADQDAWWVQARRDRDLKNRGAI